MINLRAPYLLFLGDNQDPISIKTARGIMTWKKELVVGEYSLSENITVGAKKLSLSQAKILGAKSFIIGVANSGGYIADSWIKTIIEAIELGFDIVSGMHIRLCDIEAIREAAKTHKVSLIDIRHIQKAYNVGNGIKRTGKRILTVGTDCSVGKMFTSLALEKEMNKQGLNAEFKATGQTGILIKGYGVPVDAVIADFMAGSIEELSPNNKDNHFDIIEGQGSLHHPSYAGVSLALIHGSQPDYLVLCHDPYREHMRNCKSFKIPSIKESIELNLKLAKLTNPHVKMLGIALNNMLCDDKNKIEETRKSIELEFNLPTCDPLIDGVSRIVNNITL